jgi:DNA-binding transcriptional regulator of glucitol operon
MGFFEVGIALYLVSIVAALTMTWAEQRRSAQTSGVLQAAGYAACTVWPLIAVVIMLMRVTARA